MKYRRTRAADRINMKSLLAKHDILYDGREPRIGWVAYDENTNEILGVSYAHIAAIIDPFICEQPMAALKLFLMTEGAMSALDINNLVVQVKTSNTKLIKEMERLGFQQVESKYITFKKVM